MKLLYNIFFYHKNMFIYCYSVNFEIEIAQIYKLQIQFMFPQDNVVLIIIYFFSCVRNIKKVELPFNRFIFKSLTRREVPMTLIEKFLLLRMKSRILEHPRLNYKNESIRFSTFHPSLSSPYVISPACIGKSY